MSEFEVNPIHEHLADDSTDILLPVSSDSSGMRFTDQPDDRVVELQQRFETGDPTLHTFLLSEFITRFGSS